MKFYELNKISTSLAVILAISYSTNAASTDMGYADDMDIAEVCVENATISNVYTGHVRKQGQKYNYKAVHNSASWGFKLESGDHYVINKHFMFNNWSNNNGTYINEGGDELRLASDRMYKAVLLAAATGTKIRVRADAGDCARSGDTGIFKSIELQFD